MSMEDSKNKVKIVPLISDMDRQFGIPKPETSVGHIPTKDEIRKKALDDMLRRIRERG